MSGLAVNYTKSQLSNMDGKLVTLYGKASEHLQHRVSLERSCSPKIDDQLFI